MRTIIIDDEPIIRQGIVHKMKRTGLPVTIVGEASDGIAGLELVRSVRPQVVITDIQMPGMNGLAFIREVKEIWPETEFIVVSGYDDFDYAKQAMRYGVKHYLLKPLEDDQLHESLSEIMERVEKDGLKASAMEQLQSLEESSRELSLRQELTRFLQHGESALDHEELRKLEQRSGLLAAVVLQVKPFTLPHFSFEAGEQELLFYAMKNIMMERFESASIAGLLVHHALDRNEFVFIAGLRSAEERSRVTVALEEIVYGMNKYLRLGITIGVGAYVSKLQSIPACYREARQLSRNAILHGSNRIYDKNRPAPGHPNRKSIISEEDERMLFESLKSWEADKIHRWTERRIGSIAQDPDSVYVQLEWFCVDLYLLLHKYLLSVPHSTEWVIGEMDDLQQWLGLLTDWRDVVVQMKRMTDNIIGHQSRTDSAAGKDIMEAVKAYIDSGYGEPISLQSISEKFFIHPNYFSKRFKEKYGISFIDYLTAIRMKQAALLLRDSELKIHQIAVRVGFEDAAYFSSVFRKMYGETPKQYREKPARA
ncbi:two-component system response regulator YesN [Paenibacillus endophyticus]|uniref:Two-component system response regulator YesN n=1 Tax=Paenibacillus endophyticus TaxID=1294268 RepID=A0A7W5G895_9BACL|nr:response regulator [Paenibacillus endophyticus]MBB3150385.1 two-component system response regulator YesN [Paenibacillus endophyticus]